MKYIWFMRSAALLLALTLLAVIVACGITTTATILSLLAVASFALDLGYEICYLQTRSVTLKEEKQKGNA